MTEQAARLRLRVVELENAIRYVVTQSGDDLCWLDIYTRLAKLVGIRFEPDLLPKDTFLANCSRYHDSLSSGVEYVPQPTKGRTMPAPEKKKSAAPKANPASPGKAVADEACDLAVEHLMAQQTVDTLPRGAQGAPGDNLRGFFAKVAPAVVAALQKASVDGKIDAADLAEVAADAIGRILAKAGG